jgi:plastocyanin
MFSSSKSRRSLHAIAARAGSRVTLGVALACATLALGACGSSTDNGVVIDPPMAVVSQVIVTSSTATLSPTQTVQLSAVARTSAGAAVPSAPLLWSSSAKTIATVNSSGVVTAVAPGAVTITATSGSVAATVALIVVAAGGTVSAVNVALSDSAIQIGDLAQATVSARDANNQVIALGSRTLAWSSSNASVATINAGGVISAVGIGSVQLRATVTDGANQIVGSGTLSIVAIPGAPLAADVSMPGLTFSPADIVLKVNGVARFIFPAMDHNVFWRPSGNGAPADINTTSNRTVSLTFTTPGVYSFVCTLHDGMAGRVIVSP